MSEIAFGSFVLDVGARQLFREGKRVRLEPKVMDLLLYLARHRGRCISKEELRAELWPNIAVGDAALARLVKELRKGLVEDGEQPQLVRTLHARGYQFAGQAGPASPAILASRGEERPVDCSTEPRGICLAPALSKAVAPLERNASCGLPAIVEGETGTGKECVARAVHSWSQRRGELCILRCSAQSEEELDAVLSRAKESEGTLVLDEVGELGFLLQARLLARLGSDETSSRIPLLRRTVVTSQRSLLDMVERGELRGDLFARLNGITVVLPPLRNRREDITALISFFFEREASKNANRLPPKVLAALIGYDWPFNVWELKMFVLRWCAFSSSGIACELPTHSLPSAPNTAAPASRSQEKQRRSSSLAACE